MADDKTESVETALDKSLEAEEYEVAGRRVKRPDLAATMNARAELLAEDRVARQGNILERARHGAPRRDD